MSWVFGIIKSDGSVPFPNGFEGLHSNPLAKFSSPNIYIALGGIPHTCFYEVQEKSPETGWAMVGVGIRIIGPEARILTKEDWKKLFSISPFPVHTLDGHFIAVRWNKNEIEFYSDQLGIRTLYFGKCREGICFSTRCDWVAQVTQHQELNLGAIGGRWLLFNQLTYDSCIKGIERLGPSGNVILRNGAVIKNECHPFLPEFKKTSDSQSELILESLIRSAVRSNTTVALALSGGFDSRTILAILMAEQNTKFDVFTFGESEDPDVKISTAIAKQLGIQHHCFQEPIPDIQSLIPIVHEFAAQNMLVEPVSAILRLRHYSELHSQGYIIIDGGFGEIARRQYLNRMIKLGRSALFQRDTGQLFQLLSTHRSDIFTQEFTKEMKDAVYQDLDRTLETMPPAREIGIANFVDLLSVRARVPNFGGPEQIRSDAMIMSFMPMVQPTFLRSIFKTDIALRNNGRLYKRIIRMKASYLQKFPLVKAGMTYPYGLTSSAAWLVTKVKSKISTSYNDSTPDRFLHQLREFISDSIHTSEVISWYGYDRNKVQKTVEAYYKGEKNHQKAVNWWLTFEIWKRSLKSSIL